MAQSLFMVRVPEVEPYVAHLRERFDPSARRGLGAHITVLHTRTPPAGMEQSVIGRVAAAMALIAPFIFQVVRVARFPGTLYLVAEPATLFLSLRAKLAVALSVAGETDGHHYVPHVSVVRKSAGDDRDVEAELGLMLRRHGPIGCACTELVYLEDSTGAWRPVQAFALSGGTGNPSPAPS